MKLSIILPVYGVEKYIEDCIQSCIENIGVQSDDVEVLVVDDGSKDQSIEIAKGLTQDYTYFRFISQKNQGLSMARNNGMEAAKGDYVWFVDPDDIIAKGIVNSILNVITHYEQVDMIELQYQLVDEDVNRASLQPACFQVDKRSDLSGQMKLLSGFSSPVPFHVFRRAFLIEKGLRMYPGIYHEDGEFTPRALWMASKVVTLNGTAYYYRQRRNSIMSTVNPKKGEDNMFVAHRLMDFFDKQVMTAGERRIVNNFISMAFCNGLHSAVGAIGDEDRRRIDVAAYEHRKVLSCLKESIQMKYRVLGFLGSIFPKKTVDIYLLMMRFNKKALKK